MNSLLSTSFVTVLASVGFLTGRRADRPTASCTYSSETIDAEMKFGNGEGHLSGVLGEVALQCQMLLVDFKNCRRCASVVNYILTFDRREYSTNPANVPLGQLSDRIPLHIFSSRAVIGPAILPKSGL